MCLPTKFFYSFSFSSRDLMTCKLLTPDWFVNDVFFESSSFKVSSFILERFYQCVFLSTLSFSRSSFIFYKMVLVLVSSVRAFLLASLLDSFNMNLDWRELITLAYLINFASALLNQLGIQCIDHRLTAWVHFYFVCLYIL